LHTTGTITTTLMKQSLIFNYNIDHLRYSLQLSHNQHKIIKNNVENGFTCF